MSQEEIKTGDVVSLKSAIPATLLRMTVGFVADYQSSGMSATCFWSIGGEIKKELIPVAALKKV